MFIYLLSGIKSCVIALLAQKGEIRYNKLDTDAQSIIFAINELGFEASIIEDGACSDATLDLQVLFLFLFFIYFCLKYPLKPKMSSFFL